MEVNILLDSGLRVHLEVSETDTVSHIKELISLKTGLSTRYMSLLIDNKETADFQCMEDCMRTVNHLYLRLQGSSKVSSDIVLRDSMIIGSLERCPGLIPESDSSQVVESDDLQDIDIDSEAFTWRYLIKLMDRPSLQILTASNTFKSLQNQIENHEKIPVEQQVLIFNGKRLKPEGRLTDSGVHNGDTLYLLQQSPKFIVFCKLADRTISIDCKDSDSVETLKTRLKLHLPYLDNSFSAFYKGQLLSDSSTLSETHICHAAELTFKSRPSNIQIFIKTVNGKNLVLDISPEDSVLDLKYRLQEKEGVPTSVQQLHFTGKILADSERLGNYKIEQGSTVYMRMRLLSAMQLLIHEWNDAEFSISVESGNVTIKQVKEKISCIGVAVERQILYCNGYELGDCLSLQDCSITQVSELQLELKLQCQIEAEEVIYFRREEIRTIQELKLRIMSIRGVPTTHQRVMVEGMKLDEETLISSLPRKHSSVIAIFFARKLIVRDLAGRIVTISVFRCETLEDILSKLKQVVSSLEESMSFHYKEKAIDLNCLSGIIDDLKDKAVLSYQGFFNPIYK